MPRRKSSYCNQRTFVLLWADAKRRADAYFDPQRGGGPRKSSRVGGVEHRLTRRTLAHVQERALRPFRLQGGLAAPDSQTGAGAVLRGSLLARIETGSRPAASQSPFLELAPGAETQRRSPRRLSHARRLRRI